MYEIYYFKDVRPFHALMGMDFCSPDYIHSMLMLLMLNELVFQVY